MNYQKNPNDQFIEDLMNTDLVASTLRSCLDYKINSDVKEKLVVDTREYLVKDLLLNGCKFEEIRKIK